MIIQHNLAGLNAKRNQKINESKLKKNLEKLSSGYRINRAGDDAAGLAMSENLRAAINGNEQSLHNIGDGINLIQVAEGAMQEVHAMLNRMYECSVASNNGTYSDADRELLQKEVEKLKEEIQRIAEDTDFYNIPLLDEGDPVDIQFHIGADEEEIMEIDLPNIVIGADGMNVEDVSVTTQDDAYAAIPQVLAAIDFLSEERGRLGAYQNRLEHAERSVAVRNENLTAEESRIRDTDMAKEVTDLTKDNIILQASQSMLTQANATHKEVLNLMQ